MITELTQNEKIDAIYDYVEESKKCKFADKHQMYGFLLGAIIFGALFLVVTL